VESVQRETHRYKRDIHQAIYPAVFLCTVHWHNENTGCCIRQSAGPYRKNPAANSEVETRSSAQGQVVSLPVRCFSPQVAYIHQIAPLERAGTSARSSGIGFWGTLTSWWRHRP
jgi:hypothetical protein